MLRERRIAVLISGLLLFGCATQPPTGPAGAPATTPKGAAGVGGYTLQDEPVVTAVPIAGVTASTSRSAQWFAPKNAIDDNIRSAWGPAADDDAPVLTLDLGQATRVVGVRAVLSLGAAASPADARVAVTVTSVAADGTRTVLAEGWRPAETTAVTLDLPATTTGTLELSFDTGGVGGLLVCDVDVLTSAAPTPAPSADPSASPSVDPSASPSVDPSASPSVDPSASPSGEPSPGPSEPPTSVDGVAVSSTRDARWFAAGNAIDDNPTSAWGPAPDDEAPTLTLDLGDPVAVSAVRLKLSLGGTSSPANARVTVTVTSVAEDGTRTVLADGWTPAETTLATLDVPDTTTGSLEFAFDTGGASGLLVCVAEAVTGAAPSPGPSVEPTPTPSVEPTPSTEPSPTPSVEPTPSPSVEPSPSPSPTELTIPLSGELEVPPRETDATGEVVFALSDDGTSLTFDFTLEGLENLDDAHIHVGAPGENGPVVANLIVDGEEGDVLTAADLVGELEGATIADVVEGLTNGTLYVNVHTDDGVAPPDTGPGDFPGGELRGQLTP